MDAAAPIVVAAPPDPPAAASVSPLARLMPVAMVAAMAGMTVLYLSSTDHAARSPMFLFFPAMMLVSLIGTLAYGARGTGRAGELREQRAEYLRYLDTVDDELARSADRQHRSLHQAHPDPGALWTLAGGSRMWERAEGHPDFLSVRVGVGQRPACPAVAAPELRSEDEGDPVTIGAVRRLVLARSLVDGVPITIALRSGAVVRIAGDPDTARSVGRALICQLAVLHHPESVSLSVEDAEQHWDWLKWLPHCGMPVSGRHHVVLVDDGVAPVPARDTTLVAVCCGDRGTEVTVCDGADPVAVACDELSLADALACARRLARHWSDAKAVTRRRRPVDWLTLMGIEEPEHLDATGLWTRGSGDGLLTAPIGSAEDGSAVILDIKESAAAGMGPHGLCVGATGSGKSEFLRTLTLGMIAGHSPEDLNLVLVDFKGGATFLGLETADHVSAVITNLADKADLVSRMRDALAGEVYRRQELLRAAGNLTNIAEYRRASRGGGALPALPALFIVVDEFSELLSQHPDFADLFVAIGRLGRSLGMHLLLASQRLDEGRLRGLETHLSYRICLKTFSAGDSRAVLGVPDAYHLPSQPGTGYLKLASGEMTRFQAAYVSGGYTPRVRERDALPAVRRFTLGDGGAREQTGQVGEAPRPLLETVLRQLSGRGVPAHQVWLPPLERSPSLQALLSAVPTGHLRVPIGIVDCPFEQRREPRLVDLSGAAGNVAIVGAPRSGKSTALRTIVAALAATHDADAVQVYCLDFGGGGLTTLAHLPHVGAVAGRRDSDLCRRTLAQLDSVLRTREAAFRRLGVDSFAAYRSLREDDDPYGEVFLIVDGWATLRQELDGLESAITTLAAQGLSYGVHVMIATSRWADLRPALKDQIGTRIELRLGDPADSEMDRRRAREITDRPAGRGITREGREMAVALPDVADVGVPPGGRRAPAVELLPALVERHTMTAESGHGEVVLGLGERDLAAVTLNFTDQHHLLVLGDSECGKTSLLRLLCRELVASGQDLELEIVDFRRTMLGVVETAHLTGYAVSPPAVTSRMAALTERLNARMPGANVTQRQLRDRSWWSGPDIYVVVDDYDLVAGATGNPLTPLADFLPHAKDLGLHVVVARRSGGAARAMFDPVLARMRDMGCAGVMMSAAPDEGVLLGTVRPTPLPPGRGTLVVRGRPDELIQVGWVDPP